MVAKLRNFVRENNRWISNGVGLVSGTLMTYLRSKATQRKLCFDVTAQELWDLYEKQGRACALSGVPLEISTTINSQNNIDRTHMNASLDRIDNTKGYTLDNVQWVHKTVNAMRRQYSVDEYVRWCQQVAEYHDNKEFY